MGRHNRRLRAHVSLIEDFLSRFSDAQLGISSEGRVDRIAAYLLGTTATVADMPLLDRDLYRALHSDVAQAGIDPFIHYLKNGYKEGRSPHPLLSYEYYTMMHPETARFGQSILEHYIRFGAPKGYNPSELFSTKNYLQLHPDVKASGLNPLIHYLRHPDCRPHPHFDSHFYRATNPDVVRSGFNPLAHFLMYGRAEGRPPTPNHGGSRVVAEPAPESAPTLTDILAPVEKQIAAKASASIDRRPLIFMMDAFYPQPDQDSGSLDQVNFVRIFHALGYEVAFASLMDFAPSPESVAPLRKMGVLCVTAADYISIEEFIVLNRARISTFFLSRFDFGGNWIERARNFCPRARVVFNTVDLHYIREERRARVMGDELARSKAEKTKETELAAIAAADVAIVVSQTERDILARLLPAADVRVIPLVRDLIERSIPPFSERKGIAFVGGFKHAPNIDAVSYFLDEVWPAVLSIDPTISFRVIGSNLPDSLRERSDRNVEWIGFAPELEPWLDQVRLTVAPLRYGAGAKGKVVTSLLNGVPCVASPIAAEGMGVADGEGIVVAEGPEDFATMIAAVHGDEARWASLSARGLDVVRRSYSLEHGVELVEQILPRISTDRREPL